ncbi:cytochrome P450 3A5 [Lasiosphaeria hispida]|uniref:Cytochrome P450 3A5 n=1 Tax=Lasiosphaeria hispida TaxID=260671 RepID=A0AAJ0ME10_9PEZI|nr:cytochrome P450 3A5 [Lasiosphaeria hispida]
MADLQVTAFAAFLEAVALSGLQGTLEFSAAALLPQFLAYFIAQYALVKLYRLAVFPHFVSPLRNVPGPKDGHILIGQMKNILGEKTPVGRYVKWGNDFPGVPFVRFFDLANKEVLLVNTPEAHKELLQTYCYAFVKPAILFRYVGDITGRGLLFAEGATHKRQRRTLLGLFSVPNLKRILPVFHEKAVELTGLIESQLGEDGKGFIEVVGTYSRATIDAAGLTILGVNLGNLVSTDPKMNFLKYYERVFEPGYVGAFIMALNMVIPGVRKFIPLEANTSHIRATQEIRSMMLGVVRQRIRDMGEGSEMPKLPGASTDLLTLLVEERKKLAQEGSEDVMTEEEINSQMLTFLAAGHETTAAFMSWSLYALATGPAKIQDKLRAEVMGVLAKHPNSSPTWGDIDGMHYLRNFCTEVLRLYCPPTLTYREAVSDMTLCGTFIPKGTNILFVPAVVNRSKAVWGPDADEFNPDRWDNLQGEAASPYAFESFSNGPRFCIGKHFAIMEYKSLLIEAMSKFRFSTSPQLEALGGKMPELQNPGLTLRARGGLQVGVERL